MTISTTTRGALWYSLGRRCKLQALGVSRFRTFLGDEAIASAGTVLYISTGYSTWSGTRRVTVHYLTQNGGLHVRHVAAVRSHTRRGFLLQK
jgi:hypothetical protein